MDKKQTRLRRARRTRAHIKTLCANRLCIHRTPRHIYAQVISPEGDKVLFSASTLDAHVRNTVEKTGGAAAAAVAGKFVAERAKAAGALGHKATKSW